MPEPTRPQHPQSAPTVTPPDAFARLCASLDELSAAIEELAALIKEGGAA